MLMEENKNQPNKENMSNKDDNATHLNDSHRNEATCNITDNVSTTNTKPININDNS